MCPASSTAREIGASFSKDKCVRMKHFENDERARIEDAGHGLQHDKPDEVLDLLKKFLEQAESK